LARLSRFGCGAWARPAHRPHSDPHGLTLAEVRRFLRSDTSTQGCALFWDIASRPQPEVTDEEEKMGEKALAVMSSFYASITGTAVLQQRQVPPRPPQYDGSIMLFGFDLALMPDEATLRDDLSQFGTVVSCAILPALVELKPLAGAQEMGTEATGTSSRVVARVKKANAIVRFKTHAEAEAALEGLKKQRRGAATLYNDTPYGEMSERGRESKRGRGWCVVEQGAAYVVAAHLNRAKEGSDGILGRYAHAERCRPKVIDITGGQTRPRLVSESAEALLRATMRDLDAAHFTFPSDHAMATAMMANFEYTVKMAVEQASILADPGRTVPPEDYAIVAEAARVVREARRAPWPTFLRLTNRPQGELEVQFGNAPESGATHGGEGVMLELLGQGRQTALVDHVAEDV